MKNKYGIGFFAAVLVLMILMNYAFQTSYRHARAKAEARIEESEKEKAKALDTAVSTEGTAVKEKESFYLKAEHGYVVVYLSDRTTVFDYTDLAVNSLPRSLQEELKKGKVIKTAEELYGFLENYSS